MKKENWKANGICLENAAIEAVKCDGNTLVIAGPGAGKTELLAQKAGYLFTTDICKLPRKILAISFKKDAADNIRERIASRYGDKYKDRFISLTYDAFFKSILDRFQRALPEDYKINVNYEIADIDQQLKAFFVAGYSNMNLMKPYEAKRYVSEKLDKCNLPLIDNKIKCVWDIMLRGNKLYKASISFSMIAKLALLILKTNIYIKKIIRATFSHVFLDEFQDTTNIQYEIVKELFKNTGVKLTAVGDNKQRIMLWAGARKTVFDDFIGDFNASCFKLLMNHRSAPRLVDLQKNMYAVLNDNSRNITASSKWNEDDGEINLVISNDEKIEADKIAEMIEEDLKNGLTPNDIAILCKQKVDLYTREIISALEKYNIRARIETEYQDLLKDNVIKIILDIILLSFERKNPEEWEYINSFSEQAFNQIDTSIEKHFKMITMLEDLFKSVKNNLLNTKTIDDFVSVQNSIISFFGEERIKAVFPEHSQGSYLKDKLNKFSKLIWEEYKITNNWEPAIQSFMGKYSIPIMTIHKSKGLEYGSVYFVGLEDSAFWSFKKQPEEDRCAFFVALSRAKQKVTFTFSSYRYNLSYPKQNRVNINEFYELLRMPNMANVVLANLHPHFL